MGMQAPAPVVQEVVMQAPVTYAAPAPVVQEVLAAPQMIQYTQPAPMTYAAPAVQEVVQYAQPATTYAAPVTYAAPATAAAPLFQAIDANHDGVVSRQEFAQALGGF